MSTPPVYTIPRKFLHPDLDTLYDVPLDAHTAEELLEDVLAWLQKAHPCPWDSEHTDGLYHCHGTDCSKCTGLGYIVYNPGLRVGVCAIRPDGSRVYFAGLVNRGQQGEAIRWELDPTLPDVRRYVESDVAHEWLRILRKKIPPEMPWQLTTWNDGGAK